MRKITAILVLILTIIAQQTVQGSALPNDIVKKNYKFTLAYESGDDKAIVEIGRELINATVSLPESAERTEFLANKYTIVANAAERIGLNDLAAGYYADSIPFMYAMGRDDGVPFARAKSLILPTFFELYTESSGDSQYYGAKHEPKNGAYYGSVFNDETQKTDNDGLRSAKGYIKPESVYLIYYSDGNAWTDDYVHLYTAEAEKNGAAVLFAWNKSQSSGQISDRAGDILSKLSELKVPVFLRYAAEMNDGSHHMGDNPEGYIAEFRQMADLARSYSDNIAMVWSPIDIASYDRPFLSYYPGDEYVDWVGVSSYTTKYFLAQKDHGANTESFNATYLCDNYASPLLRLRAINDFMRDYNINKPMMISEGGVSNYIRTENEDTTQWAKGLMTEMYSDLVRAYPKLKLICYFNNAMDNEPNDYSLYKSQELTEHYNSLVANPYYISPSCNPGYNYRPFCDGEYDVNDTISLSAVAHCCNNRNLSVDYYVDGTFITGISAPPYEYELPLNGIGTGKHILRAVLHSDGTIITEKEYELNIKDLIKDEGVSIVLNRKRLEFADSRPMSVHNRTMIPLRGVLEALGYSVSWNESDSSVRITGKGYEITVPTNSHKILIDKQGKGFTETVYSDVNARVINGRTLIPLRVLLEKIGAKVEWNESEKCVYITE